MHLGFTRAQLEQALDALEDDYDEPVRRIYGIHGDSERIDVNVEGPDEGVHAAWRAMQRDMRRPADRVRDRLFPRPEPVRTGFSRRELEQVLDVIDADDEIREKRIFDVVDEGDHLLVKTGVVYAPLHAEGLFLRLRRDGPVWVISSRDGWGA